MNSRWVDDSNAALFTDLYELTMLQSYFAEGMNDTAVFDLFVRRLPANRNYLIACGIEHVLDYLEAFAFSEDAIEYLRSVGRFSDAFLSSLRNLRFTGDVYAVPEGTVIFPNEPLLEIVAPMREAQIIETFLMNQIQLATLAATKAARVVQAARGRPVVDFGVRRMHGADAGLKEPRAFYIAGVDATSNVLAGRMYGIPLAGTMAHSYIQAFNDELEAFRCFVRSDPAAILLVDTYNITKGIECVIQLARELRSDFRVSGVRLDSGDIAKQAAEVRMMLDRAGLQKVRIFASNSLDEYAIERLLACGAPIDGFGVGTHMATSSDAPVLDTAYKLAEYAGQPKLKLSESKATLPGRKQIFRTRSSGKAAATAAEDTIGLYDEHLPGDPLLVQVMTAGRRVQPPEPLQNCRDRCRAEVASLPENLLSLTTVESSYPVHLSLGLTRLRDEIRRSSALPDTTLLG
jgi:nicotinate phosphoribosyltransferase